MARDENLADHFIRCAGIAGVYVDADGAIGAVDHVSMFGHPDGRVLFCCARGNHAKITTLAVSRATAGQGQRGGMAAVRSAAAELGVGLTLYDAVIQRAFAAVATVNVRIAELQKSGGMKDFNAEFKATRKSGTVVRYQDFLHAKKMFMLETVAGRL